MSYKNVLADIANGKAVHLAIVGDSTGMGYCAAESELIAADPDNPAIPSWANLLRAYLQEKNADSTLTNKAVSGYSTQNHINNGTVAVLEALPTKPDLVIIALGINDCGGGARVSWPAWMYNMQTLVQQCIEGGMIPVLMQEHHVTPNLHTVRDDGMVYWDFIDYQRVLSEQLGLGLIDTYTNVAFNVTNIADSVHPTPAGHALIYQEIIRWVERAPVYQTATMHHKFGGVWQAPSKTFGRSTGLWRQATSIHADKY